MRALAVLMLFATTVQAQERPVGPLTLDQAVEMCRAAAEDGVEVLAATPHVRDDYPTTPEQMEAAFARVSDAAEGVVRLVPGGELALGELDRPAEELRRFALAGNPRYLLVETPYYGWPLDLGSASSACGPAASRRCSRTRSATAPSRSGRSWSKGSWRLGRSSS